MKNELEQNIKACRADCDEFLDAYRAAKAAEVEARRNYDAVTERLIELLAKRDKS